MKIKNIQDYKSCSIYEIVSALDIKNGDTIHISSDITAFYEAYSKTHNDFSLEKILHAFMEAIGEQGTILLPTYSWNFCHGKGFDIKNTPSQTGSLGTFALKYGFVRTKHPIYSYAVWGKDSQEYLELKNIDGWGDDSPFALMLKNKGYWIQFCVPVIDSLTFEHYVEKHIGVSFRYNKEFTDFYTDENGITSKKTYTMYVRDLNWADPLNEEQWEKAMSPAIDIDVVGLGPAIRKYKLEKIFEVCKKDLDFLYK